MDLNTKKAIPEWLDAETIQMYKEDLAACSNPYSEEEALNLPFDGKYDVKRDRAYRAKKVLTEYGLI